MKTTMKHIAWIAAGASMLFTACIGDLDTLPLNPSDSTSETVYGTNESGYVAGLTKLYFCFVSNETTDLQVSDAGASELTRAFWTYMVRTGSIPITFDGEQPNEDSLEAIRETEEIFAAHARGEIKGYSSAAEMFAALEL